MPSVPVPERPETPPVSPEELYDRLAVTDSAIGALWRHQAYVLGAYHEGYADKADVALELPTGSGKTLVGLLIADWRRRITQAPSAFVCPTRQLARQAYEKAVGYGIPAVLLTGPGREWDPADETKGLTGEATIVSVYSHIFNTNPRLSPRTLVLDDAHAGEGPVAQNWSLEIERDHQAYQPLLEAIAPALSEAPLGELRNADLAPHSRPVPQLVGPAGLSEHAENIRRTLDSNVDDGEQASYPLSELRGHFPGCLLYVGWGGMLLRPFIPPTRFHAAFEDAEQRVYLSATLGQGGELERSFGRTKIPRVATPADWERHGSGRRLALLPRAGMNGASATEFIRETIASAARALVLVPSNWHADEVTEFLPGGWTVLTKRDVDDRLHPFQTSDECALVLANRYDGIDLPGDECRLILISGLPAGTHLQERFLVDSVGARSALRERIRTRLMQGMGRATRSRTDRAVVLIAGESLLAFLRDPENLRGLRPELQAEIKYGVYLAGEEPTLEGVVESFLDAGEDWAQAERYLREQSETADNSPPDGAAELASSAPAEVLACEAAWRGEPDQACAHAQVAVRQLNSSAVAPYRTLWKALAAHWAAQHALQRGDPLFGRVAAELSRDAAASARSREWRPPLPEVAVDGDAETLETRAVRIAQQIIPLSRSPRGDRAITELEEWINSDSASTFERGLERLGQMLGYESVRPGRQAAPDGAWRDSGDHLLWEAKSEQLEGGSISARIARQANTHPTWVERELDWDAEGDVVTMLVSPRQEVDQNTLAVAADHLFLVSMESIRALGERTAELWRALMPALRGSSSHQAAEQISQQVAERGLTTGNLVALLEATRITDMTAGG